jgi:hypothetical protein
VGYSPERYSGPAFTNYHNGGNEFLLLSDLKSRANDFRIGADGKLGPIDFSFQQGFRRFHDDSSVNLATGINRNPAVASFTSFLRSEPTRGSVNYTTFSVHSLVAKKLDVTARIVHSNATSNSIFMESFAGPNFNTRVTGQLNPPNVLTLGQFTIPGNVKRPNTPGIASTKTRSKQIINSTRVTRRILDTATVVDTFMNS